MRPNHAAVTLAERYDLVLQHARHQHMRHNAPRPLPTKYWPTGNLEFLVGYRRWLLSGGMSESVTNSYHVPMAGHVLGLTLKPYPQLDPDRDLTCARRYIVSKRLSNQWTKNCLNSLRIFRRYLQVQTGREADHQIALPNVSSYSYGLPGWLVSELETYQQRMQRNWRLTRLQANIRSFWSKHAQLWRYLFDACGLNELACIEQRHVLRYVDIRAAGGISVQTINAELQSFHGFLLFLQDQEYDVPKRLLRIPSLRMPERIPRYLTNAQIREIRDELERSVAKATLRSRRRLASLHLAAFHLLWQCGLRLGEVEELRLEDLDLADRRLMIRDSKNRKDRTVYVADAALQALQDYLAVRGWGGGDYVFLYRNAPLKKDLVRRRLKEVGRQAGVNLYPHRLRHTCATQLLNAGCPVTTIQRFLGHKRLSTTMIYARAYDQVVADDYFAAMQEIERSMDIAPAAGRLQPIQQVKSARAVRLVSGQYTTLAKHWE